MGFISTEEAAERWHLAVRAVQNYCKDGRIPGAVKYRRSWMVPDDAQRPPDRRRDMPLPDGPRYLPHVLVCDYLPILLSEKEKAALTPAIQRQYDAEMDYFRCRYEDAIVYAVRVSRNEESYPCALTLGMLAAVALGQYDILNEFLTERDELEAKATHPRDRAVLAMAREALYVSMYAPQLCADWLKAGDWTGFERAQYLFLGYLRCKYLHAMNKSGEMLGVAHTTLSLARMSGAPVTITDAYLYMVGAAGCADQEETARAERCVDRAMDICLPTGLLSPFIENMAALRELTERKLKARSPDAFRYVTKRWPTIWKNWVSVHNQFTCDHITLLLNFSELTIATYAAEGLTNAEIGARVGLSAGRVKNRMREIFDKLCVSRRSDLADCLLLGENFNPKGR